MTDLTREGLVELAERCEQASGPDRELDAWIWWHSGHLAALCPEAVAERSPALAVGYYSGRPARVQDDELTMANVTPAYGCPAYTASLDAAMTLIPEGRWYWAVKNYPNAQCAADIGGIYIAVGATPALALCAASLTARARAMEAGRG